MWELLQTVIISVVIIWIVHTLIQYLQETYTVKKNKDVLSIQSEKYEKMIDELLQNRVDRKEECDLVQNRVDRKEECDLVQNRVDRKEECDLVQNAHVA